MRKRYDSLRMKSSGLIFGKSPLPVTRGGIIIGGGKVIPEIKFTLPPMDISAETMEEIKVLYGEIIEGVCRRAVDLHQNEIIVEFELLPEMTVHPDWGASITALLHDRLVKVRETDGLKSLLRVTPVDIRESRKPPRRREGRDVDTLFESFHSCAIAGADLLSIESIGGKEVTDQAIMAADLRGIIFGMGILGCVDMEFLWDRICSIARETSTIPAGDTACGIGNTAMILADQGYIPRVFAAVVRAVTAVRSLVAYECGAVGPGKDCGYENVFLKAITGYPMSLEGKSAACAHFSNVGNIAGAYADLWSNESVQHIKLLSGMAPVVSMEQLIYDCRLFNASTKKGVAQELRDLLVDSDASLDPQAFILKPDVVLELAGAIVGGDDYTRSVRTARKAVELLEQGTLQGGLTLIDREKSWLERMHKELDAMPIAVDQFVAEEKERWKGTIDCSQYGLASEGL